jgi:hypothetical protein
MMISFGGSELLPKEATTSQEITIDSQGYLPQGSKQENFVSGSSRL